MSNLRITEDGDYRITEGGDYRILEGADIGQVVVSSPAGSGKVSTNTPGNITDVTVTAPAAVGVGYTSASATGAVGTVTLTSPLPSVQAGAGFSVALPQSVTVSGVAGGAQGGGIASSDIPDVAVTAFLGGAVGYTSAVATGDLPDVTVTVLTATVAHGHDFSRDIPGPVSLTAPETTAGGGGFITTVIPAITVTAPSAAAVGYTSATGTGSLPEITTAAPAPSPHTGVLISGGMPTTIVSGPEGGAVGQAAPAGTIPSVRVTPPLAISLAGGSADGDELPNDITVTGIGGAATGESRASPDVGTIIIVPPEDDAPTAGADISGELDTIGVSVPLGVGAITGEGGFDQIVVTGIDGSAGAFIYAGGDIGTITVTVPRVSTGKKIKVADALFRGLENFDAIRQIKKSS